MFESLDSLARSIVNVTWIPAFEPWFDSQGRLFFSFASFSARSQDSLLPSLAVWFISYSYISQPYDTGGWGHCPPGTQCGLSILVQHPGLPGSLSSLPDLSVLLTTLKEKLGSACTHILSYTRHLPFLSAWKLHKGLYTET